MQQNVGVFQHRFHALGVGDEIRRNVTPVELHAFHHVQIGFRGLALFHGNNAVLADFLHGLGDQVSDIGVVIG